MANLENHHNADVFGGAIDCPPQHKRFDLEISHSARVKPHCGPGGGGVDEFSIEEKKLFQHKKGNQKLFQQKTVESVRVRAHLIFNLFKAPLILNNTFNP